MQKHEIAHRFVVFAEAQWGFSVGASANWRSTIGGTLNHFAKWLDNYKRYHHLMMGNVRPLSKNQLGQTSEHVTGVGGS